MANRPAIWRGKIVRIVREANGARKSETKTTQNINFHNKKKIFISISFVRMCRRHRHHHRRRRRRHFTACLFVPLAVTRARHLHHFLPSGCRCVGSTAVVNKYLCSSRFLFFIVFYFSPHSIQVFNSEIMDYRFILRFILLRAYAIVPSRGQTEENRLKCSLDCWYIN